MEEKEKNIIVDEEVGTAAPIIKNLVFEVLKENMNKKIPLKSLKDYVEKRTGKVYSSGSFSGAMRDLVEESNGRIVNIERGYYAYLKNFKSVQLKRAIDEFILSLDSVATGNILELTDEDISTIRKIPDIKNKIAEIKKILS